MELKFDAKQMKTLNELVLRSDIVSMHAPGSGGVLILSVKHFVKMKNHRFL